MTTYIHYNKIESMNYEIYLGILNFVCLYSFMGKCVYNIIDYHNKENNRAELAQDQQFEYIWQNNLYKNIIEDTEISDELKSDIFDNVLDINSVSLNRLYIMHFIFVKHGIFYASQSSSDVEAFNSYEEYFYYNKYFNLYYNDTEIDTDTDTDTDTDIDTDNVQVIFNDKEYNITNEQNNFISWIYYSGLYDYLMQNQDIKKRILDEMNEKKLLIGNDFLKYQIFLLKYNELAEDDEEEDIQVYDEPKEDEKSEEDDDKEEDEKSEEDVEEDTQVDNKPEEDDEPEVDNYDIENDKMLKKTRYNIEDIDKYTFLNDLTHSTINLLSRLYFNLKQAINDETNRYVIL